MKKLYTTLVVVWAISQISYGQNSNPWPTTGNVSIGAGASAPGTKLTVAESSGTTQKNIAAFQNITNGAYTSITAGGSASTVSSWINGQILEFVPYSTGNGVISSYTGSLLFQTNNRTNQMVINSSGYVGIGTNTPNFKLDVNGVINTSSYISNAQGVYVDGATGTGMNNGFGKLSFRTNNVDGRMVIGNDGNVGIGSTNPLIKLDVQGDIGKYDPYEAKIQGLRIGVDAVYGASGARELSLVNKVSASRSGVGGNTENYIIRSDGFDTYLAGGAGNLIYGGTGSVGIGTVIPDAAYKLSVNGKIRTKEIRVDAGWSDYVFDNDYKLKTIPEVEAYIKSNHHLPDVPSAAEVEKNGVALGETSSLLLKKIEELTLYLIEKDKQIKQIQDKLDTLTKQLDNNGKPSK